MKPGSFGFMIGGFKTVVLLFHCVFGRLKALCSPQDFLLKEMEFIDELLRNHWGVVGCWTLLIFFLTMKASIITTTTITTAAIIA
jgi:hypothetical protein